MTQHKRFESKQFFRSIHRSRFFLCASPLSWLQAQEINNQVYCFYGKLSTIKITNLVRCAASYGFFLLSLSLLYFVKFLLVVYIIICCVKSTWLKSTIELDSWRPSHYSVHCALRARTQHKWLREKKSLAQKTEIILFTLINFAFRSYHCRWPATLSLSRFRSFPCACGVCGSISLRISSKYLHSSHRICVHCMNMLVKSGIWHWRMCSIWREHRVVSACSNCYRYQALFCGDGEPNRKCQ